MNQNTPFLVPRLQSLVLRSTLLSDRNSEDKHWLRFGAVFITLSPPDRVFYVSLYPAINSLRYLMAITASSQFSLNSVQIFRQSNKGSSACVYRTAHLGSLIWGQQRRSKMKSCLGVLVLCKLSIRQCGRRAESTCLNFCPCLPKIGVRHRRVVWAAHWH